MSNTAEGQIYLNVLVSCLFKKPQCEVTSLCAATGPIHSDKLNQSLESKRHLSAWVSSVWNCETTSEFGSRDPAVKSHPNQILTIPQF